MSATTTKVLADLKKLADPRAVKIWARMGMPTDTYLGVSLTKLRDYGKKLKKNHELALELWESGVHDARLLAAFVEDPKQATQKQLESWFNEADFFDITDKIAQLVVPGTSFAGPLMVKLLKSKKPYPRRAGWFVLAYWGAKGEGVSDAELVKYLDTIEQSIHAEQNWVKEGMNWALINIGARDGDLKKRALAAAKRIGKIEVDYGETSCKLPDAIAHLSKR